MKKNQGKCTISAGFVKLIYHIFIRNFLLRENNLYGIINHRYLLNKELEDKTQEIEFQIKCYYPSLKHFTVRTSKDGKSKMNEHVLFPYNITDNLYQTNSLNSSELTSYNNECSEILFEIQCPPSNFSELYQKVIKYKAE